MLQSNTISNLKSLQPEVLRGLKGVCTGLKTAIGLVKAEKQQSQAYMQVPKELIKLRKEAVEAALDAAKQASSSILPQDIFSAAPELGSLKSAATAQLDTLENTVLELTKEADNLLSLGKQVEAEIAKLDNILDFIEELVDSIDQVLSNPP